MTAARATIVALLLLPVLAVLPGSAAGQAPAILSVEAIIEGPSPLDLFQRPLAITADSTLGMIIIADSGNHRLVTFDEGWRSRGALTYTLRLDHDPLGTPKAVAIDPRGRLFVVDDLTTDIEIMNWRGSHIAWLRPIFPAEMSGRVKPQDVHVGASGRVYVLYGGDRPGVLVMEPDGTPALSLGFAPVDVGPFAAPVSIAVNASETRIAVLDALAERAVLVYSGEGRPLSAFGEHSEAEGGVSVPVDLAFGPHGGLWLTDTMRHSISVYSELGEPLGRIGGFGNGPGQFNFPIGCAFIADNRIAVLERAGSRCQVFEVALPDLPVSEPGLEHSGPGAAGADHATLQWR